MLFRSIFFYFYNDTDPTINIYYKFTFRMKKISQILIFIFIVSSFSLIAKDKKVFIPIYDGYSSALNNTTAVASSAWNLPSTWSTNQVPNSTDDVIIPNGISVTLGGDMSARSVAIEGILTPENLNTDFALTTKGVMVLSGGLFLIGSELNPYLGKGLITLTGSNPSENLMSNSIMGTKLIGVMPEGRLELHGAAKKPWTQLNATANAGATSITLKETINWEVGDEIVIASTDFDGRQAEKRTITAINGNVLMLDSPLIYMHWGKEQIYNNGTRDIVLDERAEVGLLTRNLKIQGDSSSELNGFGGHIMSMTNSISNASNIELYRMGQKSKVGRYPWHWHLLGDADGQFIKNAGIHNSFNRVITVHGTNNTLVEGNVAYDFIGHGYFLENGSETGNLFKNNLGVVCKRPVEGEETTPSDIGSGSGRGAEPEAFPVTFWIANPNNDFIGNVSAGSDGSGFWHVILEEVLNNNNSNYVPGKQPMGIFDDNKAHSNLFSWGVDGGVDKETGEIVTGHYKPENPDGTQFIPVINRFDGYKSIDRNVWIRANSMEFYDCDFADNGRADFFSYNQVLYNSLIVGKSANVGNPQSESELEAGRSLPYPDRALTQFSNAFRGHSIYDGPSGIVNTHFDGFNSNGAKAYCFQTNGASRKSTNHYARGISFGPDVEENSKFEFANNSWYSYMYLSGLIDEDGSVTGILGARVTPIISAPAKTNHIYETGANTQMTDVIEKPDWGAKITVNKTYNYFSDIDYTPKVNAAFTPRYFITEYPDKTTHAVFDTQTQQLYFDAPVITNDLDYKYYMQYHKTPNYMVPVINGCMSNAEAVIVAYPNMSSFSYVGNATRVSNLTELVESTKQSYLIKDNTIYLKLISTNIADDSWQRRHGYAYKFNSDAYICNLGNCFDSDVWGGVINRVTLIDYGVRSYDLASRLTNDDSRDSAITTNGLNLPMFSYENRRVNFNVENNGDGQAGYSDYQIRLATRQVWEYFNVLGIDYTGPDVEIIVENEIGNQFSLGTYSASDVKNVRIGQDNQFHIFKHVKKIILRFHENNIGNLNTHSTSNVSINHINLGVDIPEVYSVSSTLVNQDTDGDGILDEEEITRCRDQNSASDFALEFNNDSTLFDGYTVSSIENLEEINGKLKGESTSSDPKIINDNFVSFNGSEVSSITFRYKANINLTKIQLFWTNLESNGFGPSRTVFNNYTGNGDWQEVNLDLSTHSEWNNDTITGFRIDPTNNDNINFEIDWIRANNAIDPSVKCVDTTDDDGDGLTNTEENSLCRNENSAADFAIEFNTNSIFDGFETDQIINIRKLDGLISGTSSGGDSKIIKTEFLEMLGSQITSLIMKIKANIAVTNVKLFWQTTENNVFDASRIVSQDYTGNGEWQEITFDLGTNTNWTAKTITGFRIDPTNHSNVDFEIDWLRAQDAVNPEDTCNTLNTNVVNFNDSLRLFPNPATIGERINVVGLTNYDNVTITVYDLSGKQVFVEKAQTTLSIGAIKAGIYFVRFVSGSGEVDTKKLLVY